jgi:hypothetical protein
MTGPNAADAGKSSPEPYPHQPLWLYRHTGAAPWLP